MKHFMIVLSVTLHITINTSAQNVGIGTPTPAFKLDVRNGSINTDSVYRIGGYTFISGKADNVLVGAGEGASITTGIFNVALGLSMEGLTTGSHNVGMGFNALDNNATGNYNIAIGLLALERFPGSENIAIGREALSRTNVAGLFNTAIGTRSQWSSISANFNTSLGYGTLGTITSQSHCTAIGHNALHAAISSGNTAVGSQALEKSTTGLDNTAVGYNALRETTTGRHNVAVGTFTLYNNTTGVQNTALGFDCGNGTTGSYNTSVGARTLAFNSTGSNNVGVGVQALYSNRGSHNTAIGTNTLYTTGTGGSPAEFNTAVGFNACANFNAGWNNTLVGAQAEISFDGQYNSIAIGNLATATDNSKVRMGNAANWSYEAYANWTSISDARYKKDVVENVPGLDFIKRLRPVTYRLDVTALTQKELRNSKRELDNTMKQAIAEKEQMVWTGFIAQEVEQAANQSGFNFSGVDKPRNDNSNYGLRYAEFVVPLVKAMQEQQLLIEELKKEVSELKKKLE
jgi:trimeric autotransporter adhesin